MKEYYYQEPRIQFEKCPGCQADIERDADQCQFCDCKMAPEQQSDRDSLSLRRAELDESPGNIVVMLTLNIVISVAGFFVTATDRLPENPSLDHEFRLSEQNQGYAASLFFQKKSGSEERFHSQLKRRTVTKSTAPGRDKCH